MLIGVASVMPASACGQLGAYAAEHTCCDKVSFVLGVLKALEEPSGEAQCGGMALAEGRSDHGSNVNHRTLRPYWQTTPHCRRTGDKLDPQCAHIEHLRQRCHAVAQVIGSGSVTM